MAYHQFYKRLNQVAREQFPSLQEAGEIGWEYMISPLELQLPASVFDNARAAVLALFKTSRQTAYQSRLEDAGGVASAPARNNSVLMAYDFHTTEAGDAYLIEVNTNAAGFLLASLMQMVHRDVQLADYEPLKSLADSFRRELVLSGKDPQQAFVVITVQDIPQQKMYPEFLMYRDWFRGLGWSCELCEAKDLAFKEGKLRTPDGRAIDLLYNRLTDFYFEEPAYVAIRDAYFSGAVCVSPHPREYWLLADKQRLVQFTQAGFLEQTGAFEADRAAIQKVLIPTYEISDFPSLDEIWEQRKSLFFKPKRSHGGKSAYRGESVSRKVFERLIQEDILIQKFVPAQKMPTLDPASVLSNWKFDVRFFAYADQVQLSAARIYQGQVTNFSSPMGGFTLI